MLDFQMQAHQPSNNDEFDGDGNRGLFRQTVMKGRRRYAFSAKSYKIEPHSTTERHDREKKIDNGQHSALVLTHIGP